MKKIKILIAAVVMTIGMQLQACNSASSSANGTEATTETTEDNSASEAASDDNAIVEDVVEEFTSSSVLPEKSDVAIVIDFNAVWCGPCQYFKPVFHETAAEYKGKARFISVDVDDNRELAMKFDVRSIPQITIVRPDGKVVSTVGAMDKAEFVKFLNENL